MVRQRVQHFLPRLSRSHEVLADLIFDVEIVSLDNDLHRRPVIDNVSLDLEGNCLNQTRDVRRVEGAAMVLAQDMQVSIVHQLLPGEIIVVDDLVDAHRRVPSRPVTPVGVELEELARCLSTVVEAGLDAVLLLEQKETRAPGRVEGAAVPLVLERPPDAAVLVGGEQERRAVSQPALQSDVARCAMVVEVRVEWLVVFVIPVERHHLPEIPIGGVFQVVAGRRLDVDVNDVHVTLRLQFCFVAPPTN